MKSAREEASETRKIENCGSMINSGIGDGANILLGHAEGMGRNGEPHKREKAKGNVKERIRSKKGESREESS